MYIKYIYNPTFSIFPVSYVVCTPNCWGFPPGRPSCAAPQIISSGLGKPLSLATSKASHWAQAGGHGESTPRYMARYPRT